MALQQFRQLRQSLYVHSDLPSHRRPGGRLVFLGLAACNEEMNAVRAFLADIVVVTVGPDDLAHTVFGAVALRFAAVVFSSALAFDLEYLDELSAALARLGL